MESLCCNIYRHVTYSMSQVGLSSPPFKKKKYRLESVLLLVHRYVVAAFAVSLQAAGCFEFFDTVGLLPGEVGVFSAEVTVDCRLFVDGATQV